MTIGDHSKSDGKLWKLCPFWQSGTASSSSTASTQNLNSAHRNGVGSTTTSRSSASVSSVARSFLPARRRLRLDPANNLYFPYEPGKQARSAVRIKNTSKSYVAFKFQTTSPKSCYMRPPGGILAPGEVIIATVFKFVEHPENNEKPPMDQKSKVKFKIMSLKVKKGADYVPELVSSMNLNVIFISGKGSHLPKKGKFLPKRFPPFFFRTNLYGNKVSYYASK
nr:vesicle-associated protein 4-1-like [Ipomoea batatas]